MAEMVPGIGHPVRGVIIRRDFEATLLHPDELPQFSDLTTTTIASRVAVPLSHGLLPQLIAALLAVWADVSVKVGPEDGALPQLVVCGRVTVRAAVAVPTGAPEGGCAGERC